MNLNQPDISLPFPVKGVTENTPYGVVPAGYALDALNVVNFDVTEGRIRGGKRPGTARAIQNPIKAAGTLIQRMRQITLNAAEFVDAGSFFTDPYYDIGSGTSGAGVGGGWGFPRTGFEGGFGEEGIDPEIDRLEGVDVIPLEAGEIS